MGLFSFLKRKPSTDLGTPGDVDGMAYPSPTVLDLRGAVAELSRVVKANPDALDVYMALGNLYRAQGEVERAVQLRSALIVRPGLAPAFKAKAYYELAHDYKRGGFVDRALAALDKARELAGENEAILLAQARLAAATGDFERAARHYEKLGRTVQQAHYLSRQAETSAAAGQHSEARKWLHKALKVSPGSPEAWLTSLTLRADGTTGSDKKFAKELEEALKVVPEKLAFTLLEGLLAKHPEPLPAWPDGQDLATSSPPISNDDAAYFNRLHDTVIPVLENASPDLLLTYYGARLKLRAGDHAGARNWMERTLLYKSDFWPAKLDLMALTMDENQLSPVFKQQLNFFVRQAHTVKRFVCQACGLKRDTLFFVCPRCASWHSIAFRTSLTD